jgi:aconitate hydratase
MTNLDSFGSRATLKSGANTYTIYRLKALGPNVDRLPFSLRILLENLLRHEDGRVASKDDIEAMVNWTPNSGSEKEISFTPGGLPWHGARRG